MLARSHSWIWQVVTHKGSEGRMARTRISLWTRILSPAQYRIQMNVLQELCYRSCAAKDSQSALRKGRRETEAGSHILTISVGSQRAQFALSRVMSFWNTWDSQDHFSQISWESGDKAMVSAPARSRSCGVP